MNTLFRLLILILFLSCNQNKSNKHSSGNESDSSYSLIPIIEKTRFDTLHDWDLGEALLEPIQTSKSEEDEIQLLKKLSPGQKALYYFWDLNAEVTNGGFIQYYWNGYGKYIPALKEGLTLIGDSTILDLVKKADSNYQANRIQFVVQKNKDDWEPLYEKLKVFDTLDNLYYQNQQNAMVLFERYIRKNPKQFLQQK